MVTMPSEAASDYKLILDLLAAGMDVMRINCAHDDVQAWEPWWITCAGREAGRQCRFPMDLAGPKLRTGRIEAASGIVHWKAAVLPVGDTLVARCKEGDVVTLKDTRGNAGTLRIVRKTKAGAAAECLQNAYVDEGTKVQLRRSGRKLLESQVGSLPAIEAPLLLQTGDCLILTEESTPGGACPIQRFGAVGRTRPRSLYAATSVFHDPRRRADQLR